MPSSNNQSTSSQIRLQDVCLETDANSLLFDAGDKFDFSFAIGSIAVKGVDDSYRYHPVIRNVPKIVNN